MSAFQILGFLSFIFPDDGVRTAGFVWFDVATETTGFDFYSSSAVWGRSLRPPEPKY